jgi:flotillin
MDAIVGTLVAGGVVVVGLIALIATIKSLIVIVPPNSAAIITGRNRQLSDGKGVGYRAVIGGRTLRIPILEEVAYMHLATIPIELNVQNAFSKGGIPLSVQAVGNIKVASEPESTFNNGVERLLGKHVDDIEALAKETLSANLRGVLATMTPEEVNEDRMKFAAQLLEEADQDLQKLGLQLDTLKIQNVTDEVGYLAAVGRAKTAQVLKGAQIAEAQNEAETKQRQAEAMRVAEVAKAEADIAVAEARNQLRLKQAEFNRQGETAERVAKVEAQSAEVVAQQNLETQRVELQKRKLAADVVEPAEAQRKAAELRARADAAPILENGKAQVEVLRLLYQQISTSGEQGFAVFMAEKLPNLLHTAVEAVKGIEIDRLVVMDGGGGDGVSNAANQRINAAYKTLEGLGSAFGIDVQQVLQQAAKRVGSGGEVVPATVANYPVDTKTPAKK